MCPSEPKRASVLTTLCMWRNTVDSRMSRVHLWKTTGKQLDMSLGRQLPPLPVTRCLGRRP